MSAITSTGEPEVVVIRESTASRILRVVAKTPVHIFLIVVALFWMVPTAGLFLVSLMDPADFNNVGWWKVVSDPGLATFSNYKAVFQNDAITDSLVTTILITLGGTGIPIFVAALAGYAFAWMEFPGRDVLFVIVIALLVVPLQLALIPMFDLYNDIGIFDTILSLVLFHSAFGLPFAVFLLRNFFIGIDRKSVV